jgi:hypothetical protein
MKSKYTVIATVNENKLTLHLCFCRSQVTHCYDCNIVNPIHRFPGYEYQAVVVVYYYIPQREIASPYFKGTGKDAPIQVSLSKAHKE